MKITTKNSCLAFLLLLLTACNSSNNEKQVAFPSLKEVYQQKFVIGAAINLQQIEEQDSLVKELLPQQFAAITPEDIMKAEILQPSWNTFNFSNADALISYAKKQQLQVNGHTLIWHSQLPEFVNNMTNSDSLKTFFANHINTVASRYKGELASWDVVNEALNEDGSLRESIFLQKMGPDYITEAFRLTAAADPNTALYYNDYNNEQPAKRAGCIQLIKKIQDAGVKIDGVGIQGHWHLGKIPLEEIETSILEYAALGIKVAFTELDIEVLPRNFQGAEISQRMDVQGNINPYVNELPDSLQQQLAKDYTALFDLFLKHKDKISRVTFWGIHDGQSWLNDWPVMGRTNYPLLFDRNGQPKAAFYGIINAASK